MDATSTFYETYAVPFAEGSSSLDLSALYLPFLAQLPPGSRILDLGCGAGRDSVVFLTRGFDVLAIDRSQALVAIAARHLGQRVRQGSFEDLDFDGIFDGVWACASLLHVSRENRDCVLERVIRALKPGGILYLSFKEGAGERVAPDGRFYLDYREPDLRGWLASHRVLSLEQFWTSDSAKTSCKEERWLNAILRRRPSGNDT